MRINFFGLSLFALALPLLVHAQQSRLRQSVTRLSAQIARKMDANHRTRIAVLDFNDLDGNTSIFGKYLAETLITDLFDTGKFQVVERRLLVKALEENKLKSTGLLDPSTVKKLGQVLGADAVVYGTITDLANHVAVNARLVATDTAVVFGSASEEIEKDEDVRSIMGPPGSQPTPGATSASRPAQAASLEQNEFFFTIKNCLRRGDRVVCSGSVTNKADKARNIVIYGGDWTTAVDNNGNSYKSEQIGIGQANGITQVQLMPELPMNFFLTFGAVDQGATTITLVLGYGGDGVQPWPSKALFRNISLTQK